MARFEFNGVEVREKPNSIEVTRSTKGDYSWKIKFYFEDHDEASEVIAKIDRTDKILRATYLEEGN